MKKTHRHRPYGVRSPLDRLAVKLARQLRARYLAGQPLSDIRSWLAGEGVKTSIGSLSRFWKRWQDREAELPKPGGAALRVGAAKCVEILTAALGGKTVP